MSRGHRRSDLFLDDADGHRFLGLLAQLPERFGVELHTFVLMDTREFVAGTGGGGWCSERKILRIN